MTTVRIKSVVLNPVEKTDGSPQPFLELEDIESGTGRLLVDDLPSKEAADSVVYRIGDVLFSKLRPYLAKSFLPDGSATVTSELLVLRPVPSILPKFLFYVTLSAPWINFANTTAYGARMPRTSWETLGNYRIWLPPLEDQCRIADFLDAETARIDTLAERRKRQRAVLEERAYAVVSEALLPGVLTAPAGNRPWAWLPKISADRPLVRLGYVCRLQNGLTVDSKRDLSGEVVTRPYLRVANVQAGYLDLDSVAEVTVPREMADRTTLRSGDVLMTEGGDLDKLGRGTVWRDQLPGCLHQNHIFALRSEPGRLDGDYLALMTQAVHGRCYFESTGSRTTNLASTSSGKILDFPIPLPSIEWQRKLVEQVRGRLDSMARANAKLDSQLNLLTERRAALITAAVTGRIDVPTASGRGVENP